MNSKLYREITPGLELHSSATGLSLVRPVVHARMHYDTVVETTPVLQNLLQGLHIATAGAYYEIPIGAQALPVIHHIRSLETFAAQKKGGLFDSRKLKDANKSITNHEHPHSPIAFAPRMEAGGPL